MKSDSKLREDITAELDWDPSINPNQIGVAVKDGIVTLTGHLDTYAEKFAVQKALQRVKGVRAIALELDVRLDPSHKRSDTEIADAIETALRWSVLVPNERIQVQVEQGWVTLKGEVEWDYQREAAAKAARGLLGVVGISNTITLRQTASCADVSGRIRAALERQADEDAKKIQVDIRGATVTLQGTVSSWAERAAAYTAAWGAPGISSVINEIKVQA